MYLKTRKIQCAMAFLTASWLLDLTLLVSPLILIIYIYMTWTYNYWKDRNVPFAKPIPGFGSFDTIFSGKANGDIISEIYKQFEGERYCGYFQFRQPTLMIRDPQLVEKILIKDFSHFEDRPMPIDPQNEPLTVNLANLKGSQWRNLRHKLTPTFTSGKLKGMFEQMCNCGDNMLQVIDKYVQTEQTVDAKALVALFATDIIASCAFGLQIDPNSPEGKKFLEMVGRVVGGGGSLGALKMGLKMFFPELANLLRIRSVPSDVNDYFMAITKATIAHRQKENIKRGDFFQLLLGLKAQEEAGLPASEPDKDLVEPDDIQLKYDVNISSHDDSLSFTDELIAAQTFVFLAAGSETVSISISVALHYIAIHPEVQNQLQTEVDRVLAAHGSWTYQALKDMTYLDQVLQESMRLFPIAFVHVRECTIPYRVPDSDLTIEKGVLIVIPTQPMQTDPAYFPNPDIFDPDRFKGNNFKPSPTYSPFGDGPRICIAMRFAVLEMKVCVAKILSKYSMKLSSKTVTPLCQDPHSFAVKPLGGIWVTFHHRSV